MTADRQGRKAPRRVSPEYLERAALHYLERFASASENLRRVLMRKVARSVAVHGGDAEEAARWVEALIERYRSAGLLDDRAYAEARAASLQRRGGSTRTIRQKLQAKGIDAELVDMAVDQLDGAEDGDADLKAAIAYARRRRIGPFREERLRSERRDRDIAAMARAGFDLATARHVIEAEDAESLGR